MFFSLPVASTGGLLHACVVPGCLSSAGPAYTRLSGGHVGFNFRAAILAPESLRQRERRLERCDRGRSLASWRRREGEGEAPGSRMTRSKSKRQKPTTQARRLMRKFLFGALGFIRNSSDRFRSFELRIQRPLPFRRVLRGFPGAQQPSSHFHSKARRRMERLGRRARRAPRGIGAKRIRHLRAGCNEVFLPLPL